MWHMLIDCPIYEIERIVECRVDGKGVGVPTNLVLNDLDKLRKIRKLRQTELMRQQNEMRSGRV